MPPERLLRAPRASVPGRAATGLRPNRESSGSVKVGVARDLLKEREGDSVKGIPITPKMGRILFSELADAVLADYKMNKKKSLDDTERRIKKHLLPFFGNRRAAGVS